MNTIVLQPVPENMPTAYLSGGKTRERDGGVPHLGRVLTVRTANPSVWKLSPATVRDLVALQARLAADGAEPVRLVDTYRSPEVQASARLRYENWLQAGKPALDSFAFRAKTMTPAYTARPNESQHQWGGAIDLDVHAWGPPRQTVKRGTDEALAMLWQYLAEHGFTPIISAPSIDQSEAWHFNHLGSLGVYWAREAAEGGGRYPAATATCGCALAGTLHPATGNQTQRYIQARLNVAGYYCGLADGVVGPKTQAALEEAGAPKNIIPRTRKNPHVVLEWMNSQKLGEEQIACL